jgi:hypothetical protein
VAINGECGREGLVVTGASPNRSGKCPKILKNIYNSP